MASTPATVIRPVIQGRFDAPVRTSPGSSSRAILLLSLLFSLAILGILIGDQLSRAMPVFAERGRTS